GTSQAGFRDRRVDGLKIHDPAPRAAIADLADIPAQPCGRHRGDRSLRGSNPDVRVPVCVCRVGARSTTAALVRGDPTPDRGVAGAATRGGIPVGHGTELFGARQRSRLWTGIHEARPGDGDSRPPDLTEVALAEPLCLAPYRGTPTRPFGS